MGIWDSMSMKDQMDLFSEQLRTAKDFRNLGSVMRRYWNDRRKSGSTHIAPTPFSVQPMAPKQTHLCLDTNVTTSITQGSSGVGNSREQLETVFDGLPSPTQTPERSSSTDPFPIYPRELLSPIEDSGGESWA